MTLDEIARHLVRLESQQEDAEARLIVAEGLLSAVVRQLPESQAAAVVDDFKGHHDYLMAASLNSSGATDAWIAKPQTASEVMLFRLRLSESSQGSPSTEQLDER